MEQDRHAEKFPPLLSTREERRSLEYDGAMDDPLRMAAPRLTAINLYNTVPSVFTLRRVIHLADDFEKALR